MKFPKFYPIWVVVTKTKQEKSSIPKVIIWTEQTIKQLTWLAFYDFPWKHDNYIECWIIYKYMHIFKLPSENVYILLIGKNKSTNVICM